MPNHRHVATLGLGGNIGDPVRAMASVIERCKGSQVIELLAVSKLYRTPPWGKLDQPEFYNSCIKVETEFAPLALLDFCLELELELKRERIERWGPRTIDIDLLTYDDLALEHERLVLPHPRMHERAFVLMPLRDISPELRLHGKNITEWLEGADKTGITALDDEMWWSR